MPPVDPAQTGPARQRVGAVVLAAGLSRRMGRPKALLPWGGQPMVARVIEALVAAGGIEPIMVVTGHQAEQVAAAVAAYPVTCVYNADYAAGEMLSSVRCGLAALAGKVGGIMLVLGDQPTVRAATCRQLLQAWRESSVVPLVIPTYGGKRGHPLILSAVLVPEIQSLAAHQTFRDVGHRHLDSALQLPVDDPAVIADVDTPDDYHRALQQWEESRRS